MIFNVNDEKLLENPKADRVAKALRNLKEDDYAILSREDQEYVQTYRNEDGTFELEYRDGGDDRHFGLDAEKTTIKEVLEAFDAYLAGKDLANLFPWESIDAAASEPEEGDVEYNGVVMDAAWPAHIEAAQEITSIELSGTDFDRIPFGNESNIPTKQFSHCGDCAVMKGQLHVPDCKWEQCPKCKTKFYDCGCWDEGDEDELE